MLPTRLLVVLMPSRPTKAVALRPRHTPSASVTAAGTAIGESAVASPPIVAEACLTAGRPSPNAFDSFSIVHSMFLPTSHYLQAKKNLNSNFYLQI